MTKTLRGWKREGKLLINMDKEGLKQYRAERDKIIRIKGLENQVEDLKGLVMKLLENGFPAADVNRTGISSNSVGR